MEEIRKRIVEEIEREVMKTINTMAEKYREAKMEMEKQMERRREIPIPYMGVIKDYWCDGMKVNGGLYNQCKRMKDRGKRYCKECDEEARMNGGKLKEGEIIERKNWKEGKDGEGKKLVSYLSVLDARGIAREEAEDEARKYGIEIPEEYFEKRIKVRGKKVVRGRGRPAKEEKVVTSEVGEDLISRLLKRAMEEKK
jgi:hypothetical protein